ncbi:MAG: SNF2 helicase associated domain-containing protein [Tissierellia bacterium]|nr:SNF2 helicase associated domain-containing protein [Tissierellia bacterium]
MGKINFNINDIRNLASNATTFIRGTDYYNKNHVGKISIENNIYDTTLEEEVNIYSARVLGSHFSTYDTSFKLNNNGDILDYECNCPAFLEYSGSCKHVVAIMLKAYHAYNSTKIEFISNLDLLRQKRVQSYVQNHQIEDLISTFETKIKESVKSDLIEGTVQLEPILFLFEKDSLGIEFKIGNKRKYVVKDAYELANNIKHKNLVKYGKGLEFIHEIGLFDQNSQQLAKFLINESEIYKKVIAKTQGAFNSLNISGRHLKILPYSLDEFFDIFANQTLECHGYNYKHDTITFVDKDPDVEFFIDENDDSYSFSTDFYVTFISSSKDFTYIIAGNKFYKCSKDFVNNVMPAVNKIMMQPTKNIIFTNDYMSKFCSSILPLISKNSTVNSHNKIIDKYKIQPFTSSIYLDTNSQGFIYANVVFNYGDIEINPIRKISTDNNIVRNIIEEAKIITAIESLGFIKTSVKYSMKDESNIYEFLTSGISKLMSICEVNVSDDFKKIKIKYPKTMSMGVKLKSNLIEIEIDKLEFDSTELKDILNSYKIRKKYYRLKDCSFLNLDSDYFNIVEHLVDDLNVSPDELETGKIKLQKYRSLYLDNLIRNNTWINAHKENNFKEMIRNINESDESEFDLPDNLNIIMRNYQKTGFKWLKTLSNYSLGGILADDMGLGKTLQVISLLLYEKKENEYKKTNKPSIVVCPTSLVYNWKSELEKYAPSLTSIIIAGNAEQRNELISNIKDYDLIFTSYDLLKRDIDIYNETEFKYCILDEAQYIKNSATLNAKTVKLINSEVRFALTGTPIENSLADLWSIFDFIMPGFLYSYNKFKDKYEIPIVKNENKEVLEKLNKQIKPFILRRLKKDVLKELPDKIDTVSYAQMDIKQKGIYAAELYKLREQFKNEVAEHGYKKSQIIILAMLTRLRQICCHPSLCFENYNGDSTKLDLCMEILLSSIENGHKVLIFSQFTSMLKIIEKNLNKSKISYYKLTGATKSEERLYLANKFNEDDTQVFLISLKAGGTGLNLTGADVVIHYDPWWNISAQNQATDRAHRIGQDNKVQVFKLIVKDTIEEKIEKLQHDKKELADAVIQKGEVLINSLSKEEINSLFEI